MADFKTPIGKIRGLGAAGHGTHHWWVQRLTAIANIPLTLFLVASIIGNVAGGSADKFQTWSTWLAQPFVAVFVTLFVLNALYHMRLGLQVAVEDYVHTKATKTVAMIALNFVSIFLAVLAVFSILKIALGG